MSRFYIRLLLEDGKVDASYELIGPYPTARMAEFMSATYGSLFKRGTEVVEKNDD